MIKMSNPVLLTMNMSYLSDILLISGISNKNQKTSKANRENCHGENFGLLLIGLSSIIQYAIMDIVLLQRVVHTLTND